MSEEFTDPGPFAVGDVVKLIKTYKFHHMLGEVVSIMGPLQVVIINCDWDLAHLTSLTHNGRPLYVTPDQIRRRKPPTTGEEFVLALFKTTPHREKAPA